MRLNMAINNLTPAQVKMVRHLAHLAECQLDAMIERDGVDEHTLDGYRRKLDDVVDLWHRCADLNSTHELANYLSKSRGGRV